MRTRLSSLLKPRNTTVLWFLSLLLLSTVSGLAQWRTQTITLRAGWNAVFLEVQPEPSECDTNFAGMPVESAWGWNRRFSPVQFIQDPSSLLPKQPDWLTWLPLTNALVKDRNLFILEGGKPYLIKLADSAPAITWTVRGRATVRKLDWVSDSFNFAGFAVDQTAPPTFQSFFQYSLAHSNQPIYQLNAAGNWVQVTAPATTTMQNGQAFWIYTKGQSDYSGPLQVTLQQRTGLDYGRVVQEQILRVRNLSTSARTVNIRSSVSAEPPTAGQPALAGPVPLDYWQTDYANNRAGWTNLPALLARTNLAAGEQWELRLAVRRKDMAPSPVGADALYQSLLEITDAAGSSRYVIPIISEGLTTGGGAGGGNFRPAGALGASSSRVGLWIGSATITNVSQPAAADPTNPVPTASAFQFRLIVHVDDAGQARLLQKVIQVWQDGTTNQAGQVVEPGRYVLLTDEQLAASYRGAAVRDGQAVGRRFSTAAFGFREPILMNRSGDFGAAGSSSSCSVTNGYNDPLNPFRHKFHADHDNLGDDYLPLGVKNDARGSYTSESFTVIRQLQLLFDASDPDNLAVAGWGDNQVGGIYRETITGLHRVPLNIQGTFRLHQAARVGALNDSL